MASAYRHVELIKYSLLSCSPIRFLGMGRALIASDKVIGFLETGCAKNHLIVMLEKQEPKPLNGSSFQLRSSLGGQLCVQRPCFTSTINTVLEWKWKKCVFQVWSSSNSKKKKVYNMQRRYPGSNSKTEPYSSLKFYPLHCGVNDCLVLGTSVKVPSSSMAMSPLGNVIQMQATLTSADFSNLNPTK